MGVAHLFPAVIDPLVLAVTSPTTQAGSGEPIAFFSTQGIIALLTLAALEIVLGIDNVIFIAILSGKLPSEKRPFTRKLGISLAVITRIGLLFSITLIMRLTKPLFTVLGQDITGKSLVLILGGLFLVGKATYELHHKLEAADDHAEGVDLKKAAASVAAVVAQIMVVDIVFSLDSVITAVGMVNNIWIMVAAVIAAAAVMVIFAGPVSDFVERHPTMKVLALSFLLLIGVMLVVDGLGHHVPKGYIYFAMAFSLGVELFNMWLRKRSALKLHHSHLPREGEQPQA
jgi:predicted tellurium resistance membrane protein TerC